MKTIFLELFIFLWTYAHAVAAVAVESVAIPQKTGLLRGVVIDSITSFPMPCTVTIIDAGNAVVLEGKSFAAGFRCNGRFSKHLPPGKTRVRVARGVEYVAEEQVVELVPGSVSDLEFHLRRRVNLRSRGWYSGDSHVHMIHGENTLPVDFDAMALAAQAEDLQYLCVAQAWSMENPTAEKLEAELQRRSTADCLLTWNLEAPKNYYRGNAGQCLGHCWTLGVRGRASDGQDAIAMLLQASAHDYESDKPSFANFESHGFIHDQGGAVFYSHPTRWWMGPWGGKGGYPKQDSMRISNMAVELPLDALIGPTFDGLDVMTSSGELQANAMAFDLWRLLLNHGWRLAATASSDSCFDRPGGATPGDVRTYTYLEGPFSVPEAARATAQGRTFATSGPLLLASLDNLPPGSVFPADGRNRTLAVEAWACGTDAQGLTRLEVFRNGLLYRNHSWPQPRLSMQTNIDVVEKEDAWYSVRVFGSGARQPRACTSAFYFETSPDKRPAPVPACVQVVLVDALTGVKLEGKVTEVSFRAALTTEGRSHPIASGEGSVTIPGTARLRGEAPGYEPLCLSPFLDSPELLNAITQLTAEDLLRWETFERVRTLLGQVRLTFRLRPK